MNDVPLITPPAKPFCSCGGVRSDMQRIPRTVLMKLFLFWLPFKRYKCLRCRRMVWKVGKQAAS